MRTLKADTLDDVLLSPYRQALGEETVARMERQISNYDYYNGKQHVNQYGELVRADELDKPIGLDYVPTRYSTNYYKAIIDRKARWQMGGKHGISVPRRTVGEEGSAEQQRENARADGYERLLLRLWDENKMRAALIQAARDRLIADRVACKIVYNPQSGRLHWVWVADFEFIPIYSADDFRDFIGAVFVKPTKYDDTDALQVQRFKLENGVCFFEDGIYDASDLSLLKTITARGSLGIDFVPVQVFPVNELISDSIGQSEVSDVRVLNDITNQLNADATDSLKFEMFPMTAVINAPRGTAASLQKAPGATLEITGIDEKTPDVKVVESGFKWKDAFKDQYARVKAAMHEISGLPQIVPQELNFGGINGDALQVLFHDIITDTEEHWLSWGYNLAELHEKSVRYLQARLHDPRFAYDKAAVRAIGSDYTNEMKFVLPLPDNRKELVELLTLEKEAGFESTAGAMRRLGVEHVADKAAEISSETSAARGVRDPYNEGLPLD